MKEKRRVDGARTLADYPAQHFRWQVEGRVATLTLNRPERKNPLTFESYAELRDLFRALSYAEDVRAVVLSGAGGNFCSGGDVHEIIGPLTRMDTPSLLAFTRMTGDLVRAMRACPQPIISAVDGWGWRAVTWGPAPCCRASSGRAGPPSFCTQAGP
jgi:enoyl-CoA hydratase/carnithine racemase